MSTSPLSPDEVRAAAEVHRELGPEYSDAVVDSFLEKIDREIAARVDAHLASLPQVHQRTRELANPSGRRGLLIGLGVGGAVTGIPLTFLGYWLAQRSGLLAISQDFTAAGLEIWFVIVAAYVACVVTVARRPRARAQDQPGRSTTR